MKKYEEMAGRFWNTAQAYLSTAAIVYKADRTPNMLFPCLYNMGHSLELFLKSHLIVAAKSTATINTHDLTGLWNKNEVSDIRKQAAHLLRRHRGDDKPYVHNMAILITSERKFSMEEYVKSLSSVFSRESDYALRYPPQTMAVPEPDELLEVLPHLYRKNPPLDCLRPA